MIVAPRPFSAAPLAERRSQVNTLPKAKSKTRSKQNKDMHKCLKKRGSARAHFSTRDPH
jgi:hypothetical protein